MARSWSRKITGSFVPHLRSMKVLVETKKTAAWNGDWPPNGMLSTLARTGTFWVCSVWRPGPKVSSALPSRKKTACWLSSTMSWLPKRTGAVPLAGQRDTMVCPVGSWYWITSMIGVSYPSSAGGLGALDDVTDHLLALAPLAVERPHLLEQPVEGRRGIVPAGRRQGGDAALDLRQVVHHRKVEFVEPLELRVADLDRIEQTAGAVIAEPDRLRQAVDLPVEAVETVEGRELAGVDPGAGVIPQGRLEAPELRRQVLAEGPVHVAPQLAVLEPPITGDLVAQPLQPLALSPGFFVTVGHPISPRCEVSP